ncbi:hypothetical protein H4O20_00460 [Aequorivita sp. 609]|uniref:hypothetical protein n=1 Tax=Aequorivita TaxID=153265 RepID=UPI001620B346|nr:MULTISPECIES: hypothetical protein [Aequorivita]MBB6679914.1 hypothetical protein [Aequorivita sp. 609]
MIRFSVISLSLVFSLTSCSLKTTEGLRPIDLNEVAKLNKVVENLYFSNPEIDYVYKAKIKVYNKNFGGILIVKKTGLENHRVVFTTEFGSKLLDFQFDGDKFTKNFVVEDLDKNFIINILRDDFKLLITEKSDILEAFSSEVHNVFKTQSEERFNYYFFEKETGKLQKIINTTKRKEKVEVDFTSTEKEIADIISIKHNNFKLTIDLEKFKKE